MSETVEIMKCYNPNSEVPMCRECKRNSKSKDNEYESFDIRETRLNGWKCNGYISVRQVKGLFDE